MTRVSTGGSGQAERGGARRSRRRETAKRGSGGGSGRIALILAVVGLVLIVVFIIPRGRNKGAEPLRQATFVSSSPINPVDPTSGKPIVPGITSVYKGYTIGHCCVPSKGDWEKLTETAKDDAVRRFLR